MKEENMNQAYEAMGEEELRGQLAVLTQELDATADQLAEAQIALTEAQEHMAEAEADRDAAYKQNIKLTEELDIWRQEIQDLKQKNIDDTRRHQKAMQSILRTRAKSYSAPGIATAICAVLAALVILSVEHQLVAAVLGIPLASIFLLICVFCLGVIVERFISWNIRKPEGKKRAVHSAR